MHRHLGWMIRVISLLFVMVSAPHASATNGVVGPGNCNYAGLSSVLATVDGSGGGTITFNCGSATITFDGYKQVANAVVIDGGGTITFDGNNASGFFQSFFSATLVLKRLTLQHGVYTGGVRALENIGTLVLDHVKVINNVSTRGPVLSSGNLFVRSSTFSGNSANSAAAGDGDGGAIENSFGDLDVMGSTFNGNTAAHCGGAIYSGSNTNVTNSTFTGNSVTATSCGGAAIYQGGSGVSKATYVTIANNTAATFGGGVYSADPAVLTISRSILANNTNGNCDGSSTALVSGGHNVWFGATSCPFSESGDAAGNPMLGALGNNGGPTQTMLPAGGSAAINIIPNSQRLVPFDQRGGSRPSGGGCDAGAVEVNAVIDLIFYDDFD